MNKVISKDGTTIAFDQSGEGQVVIMVAGALGTRSHPQWVKLAALLAKHFTVISYDRRGRGDSGDTQPYTVQREIEDIEALIDRVGGTAYVYGISSGAILALEAADKLSNKIKKLALYEPPLILDSSRPPLPKNYVEQINDAIASGDRRKAVEIFMTQALLLPVEYLAPMQAEPMWKDLEEVAHTLAYDGTISKEVMAGKPLPSNKWTSITSTTLVISGENSEPFFHNAAKAITGNLLNAEYCVLDGQHHDVSPESITPVLVEFFKG
ncbi:alpha/beta fold hydrolase [Thermoflavimicrobium daqui]|jgi:pimeloyl-ACP methyl ester carboxylesterase|uniref:Alpha/beta hydrolase n=1 Tax=Thermoflavimicrobium daqui TaxID=2137476 RepID=A0A364K412_9BACL|nr:alpha/beta hydrolase [Thermoflavimicrobium daqui]RAL24128.1 alpha/beta hydrolase [Thermoflavimicrobium daqui]